MESEARSLSPFPVPPRAVSHVGLAAVVILTAAQDAKFDLICNLQFRPMTFLVVDVILLLKTAKVT